VNRGAEPWAVAGHILPQYGFYMQAGNIEAAIELRDSRRVEWARSPQGRYENGRWTTPEGRSLVLPVE
jgi:hypothetical protein